MVPHTPLLSWTQLSAGVYRASGGRYKIMRRGPSVWILIDTKTSREMRFDCLRDAQSRAQWEVAEEAKNEAAGNSEGSRVV
jgi:hypothetical protein